MLFTRDLFYFSLSFYAERYVVWKDMHRMDLNYDQIMIKIFPKNHNKIMKQNDWKESSKTTKKFYFICSERRHYILEQIDSLLMLMKMAFYQRKEDVWNMAISRRSWNILEWRNNRFGGVILREFAECLKVLVSLKRIVLSIFW